MQQPGDIGRLRIGVLGPLEVRRAGARVVLGSAMLRSLLGLLAIQPHRPVTRDEIVDTLWGEHPPKTWAASIHVQIGRLRARLEPEQGHRLITAAANGSYLFQPREGELDLADFDALVTRAASATHAASTTRAAMATRAASASPGAEPSAALLAEALACWRGPVLDGAGAKLANHPVLVSIADRRVTAAVTYADLALAEDSWRRDQVVAVLRTIAREEPLHEGLHARLMLALAESGRRTAALTLFETVRARLADELGVRPGPELRDAHVRVLRQDEDGACDTVTLAPVAPVAPVGPVGPVGPAPVGPARVGPAPIGAARVGLARIAPALVGPASIRPAQLPAPVAGFTGREETLRRLDAFLAEQQPGGVPVLALTGTAGVGKTAVAVHWAHRVRDRFPDGQLFINLRSPADAGPLRPIDALRPALRALGVPADQVPADLDEAAGLYRTRLDGKRMLVLLDDAHSPGQVRPMLPGGAGCMVMVTSRDRLRGLVARDGARRLSLDVLSPPEAVTLLTCAIGARPAHTENDAMDALARDCAYLPLALRIAAANLASEPNLPIAWFLTRMGTGNRLSALEVDGDEQASVRASFELSYRALPGPAQRLFRLLGLAPGPDITIEAAAALAGTTPDAVSPPLVSLSDAHLLSQPAPGRYTMLGLLRLYATELAGVEETSEDRSAARERLFDWYFSIVDASAYRSHDERALSAQSGVEVG